MYQYKINFINFSNNVQNYEKNIILFCLKWNDVNLELILSYWLFSDSLYKIRKIWKIEISPTHSGSANRVVVSTLHSSTDSRIDWILVSQTFQVPTDEDVRRWLLQQISMLYCHSKNHLEIWRPRESSRAPFCTHWNCWVWSPIVACCIDRYRWSIIRDIMLNILCICVIFWGSQEGTWREC